MKIKDIPEDYELITDSQHVNACKRVLIGWYGLDFDSFFVKQSDFGFEKAYGFKGTVPYLDKDVIELPC